MVSVGVARDPDIATPLSTFWYLRSEIRNTTSTEQKKNNTSSENCVQKAEKKHLKTS